MFGVCTCTQTVVTSSAAGEQVLTSVYLIPQGLLLNSQLALIEPHPTGRRVAS